jgi:hypothetical protein
MREELFAPIAEPEVQDLRRYPKPGSPHWLERYQESHDLLQGLHAAIPTPDLRVKLAMVELSEALRDDLLRSANDAGPVQS